MNSHILHIYKERETMLQINLSDLRDLLMPQKSHSFKVGEKYLIRTVTMHYTGRVIAITDSDIVLEDAAWIADTGRFSNSLLTGELSEIECYPNPVGVCRGVIVDFTEWKHPLPRNTK